MSTVSACPSKLIHEPNGNLTKSTIETFSLHHNIHNNNNNNNSNHNNNNSIYPMSHLTAANSSSYTNDTPIEHQRRRNTSLPAPHLLLQSKSDYSRTSSMLDTHNSHNTNSNNSSSNNNNNSNRENTTYCPSNGLNYANNNPEAVNLNHREQSLNLKSTSFINTTTVSITSSSSGSGSSADTITHNYHNGTRSNYNNYPSRGNLMTSQYDNITDAIPYNNDYMAYSNMSENEFGHWNGGGNSLADDLKIPPRSGFRPHGLDDAQQLSSCGDGFAVLSPPNGNMSDFQGMNRCPPSCPTPRHEEHSGNQSSGSTQHITTGGGGGGVSHTQHHPAYQSNGYCNLGERIYENPSNSPTNLNCAQNLIHSRMNCDIKNTTALSTNRSAQRSASTPTRLLVVSTASPVTSTITMTPDSSTIGFAGNKFTCSSDDGEASPTPTCSSGCPQTPGRTRKPAPTLATGRRNLKGELVDPDEADRRMKRRERNRKSAQKCRERKVQRTQELQSQVECLQLEASRLMQELDSWRSRARQCVALLQHHCPGVAIPYLSCLNETVIPACMNTFKEPMDSLTELITSDKQMDCCDDTNEHYSWKMKPSGKTTYTINETVGVGSAFMTTHESSNQLLPPMDLLHSHVTPNRSKSLFTVFSSNNNNNSNNSTKDNDNQIFTTTQQNTTTESSQLSILKQDSNHDISGSLLIPMSRSTSQVSIRGPASGSSSSSCSTYELSFPSLDNHHSHCLNETSSPFKDYSTTSASSSSSSSQTANQVSMINSRGGRSRVLSGQELLDNQSLVVMSNKSISLVNNNQQQQQKQQTWSLDYHETSGKNTSSMECCSPLSPLNNNNNSAMTNQQLQSNKDYHPMKMDSECYDQCSNSQRLNKA
ncbi:unnamed protein product [Trichobilharzia szidati]|nr:unnamed protein product [Trichobilharzia szidati]